MPASSQTASAPVPDTDHVEDLRRAVQNCRACELWEGATQAVLGEGADDARLVLVGEQPGDREDREGHPFVGPAGRLLDQGLERAGIKRAEVYITNVVKHFRYRTRGKRRIHQRPERIHVAACAPWLQAELRIVEPDVLVCLGATAAQALMGSKVRVGRDRGQQMPSDLAPIVTITTHPSAILRSRDEPSRAEAMDAFVADLKQVRGWLGS